MGEQFFSLFGQVLGINAVLLSWQGRNAVHSQWCVRAAGEVLLVSNSWIPVSREKDVWQHSSSFVLSRFQGYQCRVDMGTSPSV